jgi:hypothetical protein
MDKNVNYTINFCEDLQVQCPKKDPSQMQALKEDGTCIRMAGSAVKSQNKFKYLSK